MRKAFPYVYHNYFLQILHYDILKIAVHLFSFLKSRTICPSSVKTAMTKIFQRNVSAMVLFTKYPPVTLWLQDFLQTLITNFFWGISFIVACKAASRRASSSTVLIIHIFITLISATRDCYTFLDIFWYAFWHPFANSYSCFSPDIHLFYLVRFSLSRYASSLHSVKTYLLSHTGIVSPEVFLVTQPQILYRDSWEYLA